MLLPAITSSPPPSAAVPPPSFPLVRHVKPFIPNTRQNKHKPITSHTIITLRKTHTSCITTSFSTNLADDSDYEFRFEEEDDDAGCPWECAIMYKRNAAISNLEYCTTLERLGLGKLSSEVSRNRAAEMGLRVVKSVKDYPNGTPVLISVEVIRKKQKLRLDGIVRTVIALNCNRCGEPASQSVYSNFSLLLCEEPIEEPETINMGVIFGEDKSQNFGVGEEDDDEDSFIDLDDRLYFPVAEKVIDISKNIRDIIHIEIALTALCDPNCKGICLKCGTNLNNSKCACRTCDVGEKSYGPLGNLREQMQQT